MPSTIWAQVFLSNCAGVLASSTPTPCPVQQGHLVMMHWTSGKEGSLSPLSQAKVMVLLSLRDKNTVSMSYSDIAEEVIKVGGVHPTRQAIARQHKVMKKDKQWYPGKVTNNAQTPPTKDHFQRCNELSQWCMIHSGERPRRRSDDKSEASLAIWLERALIRRTGALNNRPSGRQLTATETAHLNSIVQATVTPPRLVQQHRPSKRLCQKEPEPERTNNLDMKSSQRVMKERCRELGLSVSGDKQVLLARILNETTSKLDTESSWHVLRQSCREWGLPANGDKQEMLSRILNEDNRLIADSQVKDSDIDQEMLKTFAEGH